MSGGDDDTKASDVAAVINRTINFINHRTPHGGDCEVCKTTDSMKPLPGVLEINALAAWVREPGVVRSVSIPAIALFCANCGNIRFHTTRPRPLEPLPIATSAPEGEA
jgi:hypothetical protein